MPKTKFYAVKIGREGPAIYNTWDECNLNVSRFPDAVHKSFASRQQAQDWLGVIPQEKPKPPTSSAKPKRKEAVAPPNRVPASKGPSQVQKPVPEEKSMAIETPSSTISLSPEQKMVLERVKQGRNVFFTGSAGTGKSVLLREIIRALGGTASSTLGITASTGIASVHIGGSTLHSWAGVGIGEETAKKFCGRILHQERYARIVERWRQVKALIIDEISLIHGELFDKLEAIAREIRKKEAPFGGIQLVVSGDFCQLPPVPGREKENTTFAFEAESWGICLGPPVVLTRVFRQKDQGFVDMLNALRFGQINEKIVDEFTKLTKPVVYDDGIEATELFPTKREVEVANSNRLDQLTGTANGYEAKDAPGYDSKGHRVTPEQMDRLLGHLVAPKLIFLKVGAQVMLIKNLIQGELVNGSVGQVIGFSTYNEALANHIEIPSFDDRQRGTLAFARQPIPDSKEDKIWPVVRFPNDRITLCVPVDFTVNNAEGGMEAQRNQVPLILAWALSVHKSQGQTLERVRVDLGRTFEHGQAYVALSRATSMKSLQVLGFRPEKIKVHPRVLAWHNQFDNVGSVSIEDEMDDEEVMAAYYDM